MTRKIAVFCSANTGLDPMFFAQAERFCEGLAVRGWELIYGASRDGLMGHFADEALKRHVVVRGAVPRHMEGEGVHDGLTELVRVEDLFERKRWMLDQAHAFAIFPGGFGTLDEALEAITWKSLGRLDKPIAFVDLKGHWQGQLRCFEELARAGAIRRESLAVYEVCASVDALFESLDRALA